MRNLIAALLSGTALGLMAMHGALAQISPGQSNLANPGPIGGITPSTGNFTQINTTGININGAPVYAGHGLIGVQTFTASGTYTPDANTNSIIVEVLGGGGGGGGCGATVASQSASAGGGSAGSYASALVSPATSVAITIGAKGTGGAAGPNNGNAGGTSSFGTLISCPGGPGGIAGTAQATVSPGTDAAAAAVPTITGATVIIATPGSVGGGGTIFAPGTFAISGRGGSSQYGQGGRAISGTGSSSPAGGIGSGGSGANNALASSPAVAGGDGTAGIIIVYEYN